MKVGEIYGKNRNKKLLVMYIDFFLMTLFGGIYNIYLQKLLYSFICLIYGLFIPLPNLYKFSEPEQKVTVCDPSALVELLQ